MKKMSRVIITIPDELLATLTDHSRRSQRSRSSVMRTALADWVAERERAEFEELMAAGYQEMAGASAEFSEDFAGLQAEALESTWRWDD